MASPIASAEAVPVRPQLSAQSRAERQPELTRPSPPAVEQAQDARAEIQDAIEKSDGSVTVGDRTLEISFNEDVNRLIVKVKSSDTGEVVRQIPPEDFVRFAARFRELLGVLFDKTA